MSKTHLLVLMALVSGFFSGCGNEAVILVEASAPLEVANQLGSMMATVDEAGRGSVTIASFTSPTILQKLEPQSTSVAQLFIPKANAANCGLSDFGSCNSNTVIRNFNSCSIGGYVLTGSVSVNWTGGTTCALTAPTQAIRITPNYTVAGNNASLTETKTGAVGVTLTWASGSGTAKVFNYVNDGVNRTLTYNGSTLLSLNTRTVTPITVTGSARGSRVLSSAAGAFEITSATTSEVCTFQPNSVSWGAANCNCATSGQWAGTCSTMGSYTMTITGCGAATIAYTDNGAAKTQAVSLDRCVQN